jgi:hypothetical protein
MRRWPMSSAPKDGRIVIGCTRVEGSEHQMRWTVGADGGHWVDVQTGASLPSDLFVEWRRSMPEN